MSIPEMDTDNVTMTINTDSSSGKAVASRLGRNRKSKHVQLRFLYNVIQDVIQRGELTINLIQEDPNNTQSSRCTHQIPSSSNNSITP
eukprot:6463226-Amphidinium_carterae.1